jgi:hypothetical protein
MSISPIKSFNTTGPCFPEKNYMLPVLSRLPEVTDLINQKYYFIIHAPRQSGKTTYLNLLTDKINSEGEMYCLCCSLESCNQILDDTIAITRIIAEINTSLKISGISILSDLSNTYNPLPQDDPSVHVRNFLNYLCVNLDKDLVVFFDEADCLTETPLITFLRQIRNGYNSRFRSKNSKFPRSLALIGMRDIRDYLVVARSGSGSTSAASPFNIKRKSLTFSNFTLTEIQSLYFQHTSASGQIFEPGAIEKAWYWSKGQPWLVNALALEAVVEILKNDYQKAITASLIDQAAHRIIMHRDTHIDSLMERLKEPRVINVMDSVFAGTPGKVLTNPDDRQYCLDLGLVVEDDNKNLQPSNQIYSEVMSRMLTDEIQSALDDKIAKMPWHNDEIIFMNDLLKKFNPFGDKMLLHFL